MSQSTNPSTPPSHPNSATPHASSVAEDVVSPAEDMRRRFLPAERAVGHAKALLDADPVAELAYIPMYMPDKKYGWWQVGQQVITVTGVVLIAVNSFQNAGQIPSGSWARDTATSIAREQMGKRPGTVAYAEVRRNGHIAVFENPL